MDNTDALITFLATPTCEEFIPAGFDEEPTEAPEPAPVVEPLDDDIPF